MWVDHRGRRVREQPLRVVVHPNDRLTLKELLGSAQKPGTANNDLNSLNGELAMENAIVTPYLTDTDSWFILSAKPQTVWYWDVQPRTAMEDDFDRVLAWRSLGVDDVLEVSVPWSMDPEVTWQDSKIPPSGDQEYPVLVRAYHTPSGCLRHRVRQTGEDPGAGWVL